MITDFICFNKIFSGIISIIWFMYIIYHIKEYYRIKKILSIYSKEEIKEYNKLKKILSRYSKKEIKEYKRQNANIL